MRLHFLIFAALRGVPFTAVPYASKVTGFLQELGIETPPLGSFSIEQLIARIDRSWDTRGQISEAIALRLPGLQARARLTNELIVRLIREQAAGQMQRLA